MKSESEFVNENFKWYIVESESEGSYQKGCRQLKTRPHYQGILRKALGTWWETGLVIITELSLSTKVVIIEIEIS